LAASPTSFSSSVNATWEGVILFPSSFGIISTLPFLKMPTHEYVVPKSMPMTGPSIFFLVAPSSAPYMFPKLNIKSIV
jgi:hypothetical protein